MIAPTDTDLRELTHAHSEEVVAQNKVFALEDARLREAGLGVDHSDPDAREERVMTILLSRLSHARRRFDLYVRQKLELQQLERRGTEVDYGAVDSGIASYKSRVGRLADDMRAKGYWSDEAAKLAAIS